MIKRILSFLVCVAMVCVYLALPANACYTAYNPWVWNSQVSPTDLSVKLCSTDYRYSINAANSFMRWNGISSGIHISSYTTANSTANMDADINLCYGTVPFDGYGITRLYIINPGTGALMEVDDSTNLVYQARIVLSMVLFDMGTSYLHRTVTHEVGHALALSHPSCPSSALMIQTFQPYYSMTITEHDRMMLKLKWGE